MFTMTQEHIKMPIKIWLKDEKALEASCLEQALHLANLPFLHKWDKLLQISSAHL